MTLKQSQPFTFLFIGEHVLLPNNMKFFFYFSCHSYEIFIIQLWRLKERPSQSH